MSNDLNRVPDWRWIEAERRAKGTASASGSNDPLINRAVTFLKFQDQARTSAARARRKEKFPTITEAHRIRFDKNDGRRDAIEIRLLAGCPPGWIAELSAMDGAVVWVYVALFFDILDRLDCGDFISSQVIGHRSKGDRLDEGKAMRWLAWIGGPHAADALLLPGHRFGIIERAKDIDSALLEATGALVARAMALAPLMARLDREQVQQIMRWRVQAAQDREANMGDVGHRRYLENVRAFLDNIELTVGRSSIPKDDNEKYYTSHVEPTAEQWAAISRGEPVPEFDERAAAAASFWSRGKANDQTEDSSADQCGGSQNE